MRSAQSRKQGTRKLDVLAAALGRAQNSLEAFAALRREPVFDVIISKLVLNHEQTFVNGVVAEILLFERELLLFR